MNCYHNDSNEILIECFHYLNIIDIFHSFDQLNYRLNILIRNIRFNLNFENIQNKFQFEQFYSKLSIDQIIQNQLYSLYLSNKNTCYPIHFFLSTFSLLQFSHLRSLTLTEVTVNNWKPIQSIISLLLELSAFQIIKCDTMQGGFISSLPISQIQTLIISQLSLTSIPNIQCSSIIHITIRECTSDVLFYLLNNALN